MQINVTEYIFEIEKNNDFISTISLKSRRRRTSV